MIKEFEFYHGAVFTQLIQASASRLCIKPYKASGNSSYVLNDNIGLYIKYSSKRMSPWRFSMQKIHQEEILEMKNHFNEVFLIVICGDDGIVILNFEELKRILNDAHEEIEWISAARNPGKEYTIKGSDGTLGRKIGKNNFPKKILEVNSGKLLPIETENKSTGKETKT